MSSAGVVAAGHDLAVEVTVHSVAVAAHDSAVSPHSFYSVVVAEAVAATVTVPREVVHLVWHSMPASASAVWLNCQLMPPMNYLKPMLNCVQCQISMRPYYCCRDFGVMGCVDSSYFAPDQRVYR